jgi:hypothetical protein
MFHVMSMAESSELLVNLHFYVYYLSNSEKAILTYRMIVTTYCFWTDSCTPGTSWQQDCNTCTCTENRTPVCTLRACLPRPVRQLPCKLNLGKHSDKLNSSVPKDYSHLGHDAVRFGRYIPAP